MRRKTRFDKTLEDLLSDNLPMDPFPHSNAEFFPREPNDKEKLEYRLANEQIELVRRQFGMSRRQFVRTGAAFTICLWAHNQVHMNAQGGWAWAGNSGPNVSDNPLWDACTLANPAAQLNNLPGEFIFDVQSHHVSSDDKWRAMQPVHHAFVCGVFGVSNASEMNYDLCQNVGRWQYIKDIYIDSSTNAGVLSPVPSAPDEQQALPFDEADETARTVEELSGTMRTVTHGYVMPNRGWVRPHEAGRVDVYGGRSEGVRSGTYTPPVGTPQGEFTPGAATNEAKPLFLDDELDWMEQRASRYGRYLRGWKVYTPYGDVPLTSGMRHDDFAGRAMNDKILELNRKYGTPKVLASHKGTPLPMFDDRCQANDDVGPAALMYPDINFIIYHTGGGSGSSGNYPADSDGGQTAGFNATPGEQNIDTTMYTSGAHALIKVLRQHGLSATQNVPPGFTHGNSPNVGVDWGSVSRGAVRVATIGKHIGFRRLCHGTDCIWSGSPQSIIVGMRTVELTDQGKAFFNLPHGFEGDRFEPSINAHSGAGYTQARKDQFAAAINGWVGFSEKYTKEVQAIVASWPTDGQPHPERTIRNGWLGRNAADMYETDIAEQWGKIDCDRVNRMRAEYLTDQLASLKSVGPTRANQVWGPRTKQEVIALRNKEWKQHGWIA